MFHNFQARVCLTEWLIALAGLLVAAPAHSAEPKTAARPAGTPFKDAVAQAKKSGQPLVVFGVAPGCSRCAALKQGLETNEEIKQLLAEYVTAEVPFAGREFVAIFDGIVKQNKKFNASIGAPSVFIFTAKGEAVYAGPNDPNGMTAGDEFKQLLEAGIEKNGPKRRSAAEEDTPTDDAAPVKTSKPAEARVWKSKAGNFSVTATLVSFDGKAATLRKSDGKTVTVPLDSLSAEDQKWLRETPGNQP